MAEPDRRHGTNDGARAPAKKSNRNMAYIIGAIVIVVLLIAWFALGTGETTDGVEGAGGETTAPVTEGDATTGN